VTPALLRLSIADTRQYNISAVPVRLEAGARTKATVTPPSPLRTRKSDLSSGDEKFPKLVLRLCNLMQFSVAAAPYFNIVPNNVKLLKLGAS